MLLVYYKNPEGKIINAHKIPPHIKLADAPRIVEEYNNKPENKNQLAYIADLQEGSLELYLFERSERKIQYQKEAIDDAIDAIDRARDCINCLEAAPAPKEDKPAAGRAYAVASKLCPMCSDCPDGCPLYAPDRSERVEKE